jgi:glycosyltransferase involved in cell wall biosynthesis
MMNLPRITIVTPSYNQAEYLPETIESVLNQSYPDLEYIIIDGGSVDSTAEIIRQHERNLAYWVSEKDRGQSHAINKGFQRCSGELFAWVNSDDVLFPGCLTAIAECYLRANKPDIIHANVAYIDSRSRITRFVRIPAQKRFFFFRGIWYAQAPVVFFKSSLFRAVGGVNERYYQAMDFDLWMRVMKTGARVVHIPHYLGGFRWHEQSKSFRSYMVPGRKEEGAEDSEILATHLEHSTPLARSFWRYVYKTYRMLTLNYLRASLDLRHARHATHWSQVVGLAVVPRQR